MLKPFQADGHFVAFPFGTDFTAEEIAIGGSLKALTAKKKPAIIKGLIMEMFKSAPPHAEPFLKRMNLDNPATRKEKLMRKIVLSAMRANGRI
jgi:hypothetical protein